MVLACDKLGTIFLIKIFTEYFLFPKKMCIFA